MIISDTHIDIRWLARRICSLDEKVPVLPLRLLSKLERTVSLQASGGNGDKHKLLMDKLFEALELRKPEWAHAPCTDSLPMVALLPGFGCQLIYGRTPQGAWLLEGPDGGSQLAHLPEGAKFAAIPRSSGRPDTVNAYSLFKHALSSRKRVFVQAGLASFLGNTLALSTSLYSLQVYDRVIPTKGFDTLIVLTIGVAFSIVLEMVVKMARSAILEESVKGMDHEISRKIFQRLMGIRMDQFPASVGTLSSQVRSYESIRAFASSVILYAVVDAPFAILFLGVIMAIAGPLVALVVAVFLIMALVVGFACRRKIELHTQKSAGHTNRKHGMLVDAVQGAESLKASGANWEILSRWDTESRESTEDDARIRRYSESASFMAGLMQQMSYVMMVCTGAYVATTTTDLTMGGIIACSILSGKVLAPVGMLPGLIVQWGHAKAALENLEKVFALECDNHQVARPLLPDTIRGRYEITDLKFAYRNRSETIAVERFVIEPGEKLGILGVVGAGKSTLLKLLAGLYKPMAGHVLLDGLDMQQISRSLLSERIGYLPQNIHLFAGTLRDNLSLGVTGVSEEALLVACESTGLMNLISGHPKGLDLEITEGGAGVSGGQRQLIALTRLLLFKPDIWLLDEPTASMDDGYEQRVLTALKQAVMPEQTFVVITHKPALFNLVDRLAILTPAGIVIHGPRDAVLDRLRQNTSASSAVNHANL